LKALQHDLEMEPPGADFSAETDSRKNITVGTRAYAYQMFPDRLANLP
jgi:hypothetical protein